METKKQLFTNESKAERLQILKDNSEGVEQFTYSKPLSAEELAVAKDKYSQNGIKLAQMEEELNEIKATFAANKKPFVVESHELLEKIKHQAEIVSEDVYLMADQESGNMEYYNQDGEMVYSRRLMPQEKQTRILSIKKTGTNN